MQKKSFIIEYFNDILTFQYNENDDNIIIINYENYPEILNKYNYDNNNILKTGTDYGNNLIINYINYNYNIKNEITDIKKSYIILPLKFIDDYRKNDTINNYVLECKCSSNKCKCYCECYYKFHSFDNCNCICNERYKKNNIYKYNIDKHLLFMRSTNQKFIKKENTVIDVIFNKDENKQIKNIECITEKGDHIIIDKRGFFRSFYKKPK